jgi:hypothetical protein
VLVSLSSLSSSLSSSPPSENESKGRSELGNDHTCSTGTCLCLKKIQKESYSFHNQPYFEMPSWQKMTVAVSRT